jgi:5-methylthioadenosine/S-adenosylhomocysteine deaminase
MKTWPAGLLFASTAALTVSAHAEPFPVLVNECATGSAGWIELLNRGKAPVDLALDANSCWQVDDSDGGGAAKNISDQNVLHSADATTCNALGRPSTCGVVAPGERVRVSYAYVNFTTNDSCRLLSAPKTGGICSGTGLDAGVGIATASRVAGQCFGRMPDGDQPAAAAIPCTPGASNSSCAVGQTCDAGNPCISGTIFASDCRCVGGTLNTGKDCGDGRICQSGSCVSTSTSAPTIISTGTNGLLLAGTIVTPDNVLDGEVLVLGDEIVCVAPSCRSNPAAAAATLLKTNGIIFPGLIDTHNHILFDIFDETDWAPTAADKFEDHEDWTRNAKYSALVDTKQYLNGEGGSPVKLGCELLKYGELKGLISGTTSIVGGTTTGQLCYGSLARTIDQSSNGLGSDRVQNATLFPSKAATADAVCKNLQSGGKTDAYLIHIGEGINDFAHKEFDKLQSISTTPGCLFNPKTSIVHGTALVEADFDRMQAIGMGLVWSPKSNVFLYGHDTDLSKTAKVPLALNRGITVALAPDWSIGGSQNLLDELRFADRVDNTQWSNVITPAMLAAMVTKNPAKLLGLGSKLGSIAAGYKADLSVIAGDASAPYEALLASTPKNVRLVMVGGKVLYGDAGLRTLGQMAEQCETLDICGVPKFVCVVAPGGTAANKLGQSYAQIRSTLETELGKYDNLNRSEWKFSPIAPLYRCP